MKILVDKLPRTPQECPHAEWRPYPPTVEEPGHFTCGNENCNLSQGKKECRCFKEFNLEDYLYRDGVFKGK